MGHKGHFGYGMSDPCFFIIFPEGGSIIRNGYRDLQSHRMQKSAPPAKYGDETLRLSKLSDPVSHAIFPLLNPLHNTHGIVNLKPPMFYRFLVLKMTGVEEEGLDPTRSTFKWSFQFSRSNA